MKNMKNRVLVINGQRVVQNKQTTGDWEVTQVDKAGELSPGIYNIYLATIADKSKKYDGFIIHVDQKYVYQKADKQFIKYDYSHFEKPLVPGTIKRIAYNKETGKVNVENGESQRGKRLSR